MKRKSGYFNKILLSDVIVKCKSKNVAFNKYYVIEADDEATYNLLQKIIIGVFKALIILIRNMQKHRLFMAVNANCAKQGALEKIIEKKILCREVVERLLDRFKSKSETLRYIAKFELLPLDWDLGDGGKIVERVASQAFDELDELVADDFFNKYFQWATDLFDGEFDIFKRR